MNHAGDGKFYDQLARQAEDTLKLKDYLDKWDQDKFLECDTFKSIDMAILTNLRNSLLEDIEEFSKYREIIEQRRTSHWFQEFADEYEALYYALKLLEAKKS